MSLPDSLPARAYLLAYDRDRDRLTGQMLLAYALRGAALVDLWTSGHVVDEDGHVGVPTGARPPADPVLRGVWDEVIDGDRRGWEAWIRRHRGETEASVRSHLEAGGWIRVVRPGTRFRRARIEMRDPRVLTRLATQVGSALRGPTPIERLDSRAVGLVAVLAAADVRTAISKERKREYAQRIDAAVARSGPAVVALKRALRQARSAAS
jgi:hypothetical protein